MASITCLVVGLEVAWRGGGGVRGGPELLRFRAAAAENITLRPYGQQLLKLVCFWDREKLGTHDVVVLWVVNIGVKGRHEEYAYGVLNGYLDQQCERDPCNKHSNGASVSGVCAAGIDMVSVCI